MFYKFTRPALVLLALALFGACQPNPPASTGAAGTDNSKVVNVRLEAAANILNPLLPSAGYARYVAGMVFQTLGELDAETNEVKPLLAKSIPTAVKVADGPNKGCLAYTFEINDAATWDNGTPVTAADVEFTFKLIFHPLLQTQIWRGYFEDLKSIEVDPSNPRKFTCYLKKYYMLGLESLCQTPIYPAYHYDPNGLLKNVPLASLLDPKKADLLSKQDKGLQEFAVAFSDAKVSTTKEGVAGSAAYQVDFFDPAQGVTLVRKPNWWGDKAGFPGGPEKIVYKLVKAEDAAINLLQAGELDVAVSIAPPKFVELQKDAKLAEKFVFKTHWAAQYNRVMINTRNPILSDRRVRQALSQAVDYESLLKDVQQGMAVRTVGPINPAQPYYAKDIQPYQFNVEAAKALLAQAGWTDSNNDGVADKMVNGKRQDLVLSVLTTSGTAVSDLVSASFQASAAKAGFKLDMKPTDLPTITKETLAGNFELAISGSIQQPTLVELYQIYHSNSLAPKGDNRTGIANPALNRLIEQIRSTEDPTQRNAYYVQAQQIIHEECPEIYFYAPQTRYVLSKRFSNTPLTAVFPGYYVQYFK